MKYLVENNFFKTLFLAIVLVTALAFTAAPSMAEPLVAFLMPDQGSTRYEERDYPGFKNAMSKLCPECEVIYQNANMDVTLQQQQFNSVITQGAKVVVIDAVDTSAAASLVALGQSQNVKVIAYDRPIPDRVADYYLSYDNEGIGRLITQSLVEYLRNSKTSKDTGGILQLNGAPTDAAAVLVGNGSREVLDGSEYSVLAEYDTPGWVLPRAQAWVSGQINRFGSRIIGVVAGNDGTGGAAIAALKAAGIDPVPPVTGNDATVAALQLIIAGDQYNTISKPSEILGAAAAEIAVALLKGETPQAETTLYGTPAKLFQPTVVTRGNIKEIIFDAGLSAVDEVCTGRYLEGCRELGIIK